MPVGKPKKWLLLLPLAVGVMILAVLVKTRSPPQQAPVTEPARTVRVIAAPVVAVVPRTVGHGTVEPGMTWEAVAEVNGRISELHAELKKGALIGAGSVLARIDPSDFQLAVARAEADIEAVRAQLAELVVRESNTRASLKIEEQALALAESELARNRRLAAQGTVTQSALEQQERGVLGQRQSVQSLTNIINLIPAERRLLEAQLARHQAQLQTARLDLDRTTLKAPFPGRVAQVNVERTQAVRQGQVLAVLDSIDVAEIAVQVPIHRMRALIQRNDAAPLADLEGFNLSEVLGIAAEVRLHSQDFQVAWDARFARLSDVVDPQTRTVGVIVQVDEPYRQARPGVRPPLIKGMFTEVELRGRPQPDRVVIPRAALHGGEIYLAGAGDRLEVRPVTVGLVQDDFAVIEAGLKGGERVVLSDLVPAIEGMALRPQADAGALERLLAQAAAGP
ncbi:MAG: efflux RND transporter periplasmic adaptor subunit [Pseudomonadota bacterium]|nr:efflux RND transporter periplasmic adaptor subunit [Pseudomonadota bacterium]